MGMAVRRRVRGMDALSPPAVSAAMLLLGSAQAFIVPTSITSTTAAQRLPASAMRRDAVRVFAQLGTSEASVAQQGTAPLHHWMDHLKACTLVHTAACALRACTQASHLMQYAIR